MLQKSVCARVCKYNGNRTHLCGIEYFLSNVNGFFNAQNCIKNLRCEALKKWNQKWMNGDMQKNVLDIQISVIESQRKNITFWFKFPFFWLLKLSAWFSLWCYIQAQNESVQGGILLSFIFVLCCILISFIKKDLACF